MQAPTANSIKTDERDEGVDRLPVEQFVDVRADHHAIQSLISKCW